MAKKGMERPERTYTPPHDPMPHVPEIQGKAKHTDTPARPVIAGTGGAAQKVWHTDPPIPADVYPVIDTDLGRDNVENDIPAADLEDLKHTGNSEL